MLLVVVGRGQRTLARRELSRRNSSACPPSLREADAATTTSIGLGAASTIGLWCPPGTPRLGCGASPGTQGASVRRTSARVAANTAPAVCGCIQNLVTIPKQGFISVYIKVGVRVCVFRNPSMNNIHLFKVKIHKAKVDNQNNELILCLATIQLNIIVHVY